MKHLLLISTGGTISCLKDTDGSLKPALSGSALANEVPELKTLCSLSILPLFELDSTNVQPEEWVTIAEAVNQNLDRYDGIIISHGTDTMAYTAAALSFILQNVKKPVILTGAQRPITEPDSNGRKNLPDAARVAAASDSPGVYIVFDGDIIKGTAASKIDTKNNHAFQSITEPRAGCVRSDGAVVFENPIPVTSQPYTFCPKLNPNVLLLKLYPGFQPEILSSLILPGKEPIYPAVILETFGAGGIPFHNRNLLPVITSLIAANVRIYCKSMCLYGGSDLSVYEVGTEAEKAGVKNLGNITTETALAKIMWELGQKS